MSQKQLVAAIDKRFGALNRRERIRKIRELAADSTKWWQVYPRDFS